MPCYLFVEMLVLKCTYRISYFWKNGASDPPFLITVSKKENSMHVQWWPFSLILKEFSKNSNPLPSYTVYIGETSRSVADRMKEHSRLTKRHPKNNEERTKLESNSAIALHVLETEHHVDFENPEILSKYWPIYRDRINAEQWFISHLPEACNLKGKTTHPAWNLI